MTARRILVTDDDRAHRLMLRAVLEESGYEVREAARAEEALETIAGWVPDLVLMDLKMPGMGGLAGLGQLREAAPELPVVMMTAYGTVPTAVQALKLGARDYLAKPLDIDELRLAVARVLEHRELEAENRALRDRLDAAGRYPALVGDSPAMRRVFETMAMVAPTDATVLISGETGTGKELVAEALHRDSPRAARPLVRVNCAALPENLLESELFGHEKGAFTGAVQRRAGRFRAADGGSIFLDEVGELASSIQAKFLRVLEQGVFEPLGSSTPVTVDVRVLAATNRDLRAEVAAGRFREDLFYRLNVVPVHLPPLRERGDDVLLLAALFREEAARRMGKPVKDFEPGAVERLLRYPWPGNVRELRNVVERAVILCPHERIKVECLPAEIHSPVPTVADDAGRRGGTLEELEREIVRRTLDEAGGNRSEAARRLGITRQTLLKKISGK